MLRLPRYKTGLVLSWERRPIDWPVTFGKLSTMSHAVFPSRPNFTICALFGWKFIGFGVKILLAPAPRFHVSTMYPLIKLRATWSVDASWPMYIIRAIWSIKFGTKCIDSSKLWWISAGIEYAANDESPLTLPGKNGSPISRSMYRHHSLWIIIRYYARQSVIKNWQLFYKFIYDII